MSCVANLDAGTDLFVNWFVPGPFKQYVPADEATVTPRLRDDLNARVIESCIEYGNLGEITKADFIGTTDDQHNNGNIPKCGQTYSETTRIEPVKKSLPANGWFDEIRIFFPSDLSNPHDTMLEVSGKIGLKVNGNGDGYTSFFDYEAKQYKDRPKGEIDQVSIQPFFPLRGEVFSAAFLSSNKEQATSLSKSGQITFNVEGSTNQKWRVVDALYEFRDKQDRVLAAIPIPLFENIPE